MRGAIFFPLPPNLEIPASALTPLAAGSTSKQYLTHSLIYSLRNIDAHSRDADYRGPYFRESPGWEEEKYVTLQNDPAGFNNIRLTVESAVSFALATGRTFVIPPPFKVFHMDNSYFPVKVRSVFRFPKCGESRARREPLS